MEKFVNTALTRLNALRDQRVIQSQNLANINTPGFRRDLTSQSGTEFSSMLATQEGAGASDGGAHRFSELPGFLNQTNEEMDIAISDKGYFYIQPESGEVALSRRGDLRVDLDGMLKNGSGEQMLDVDLEPIKLPPFQAFQVTPLGEIRIEPMGAAPGKVELIATLATFVPDEETELRKSGDGQIRVVGEEEPPEPNQQAQIVQGFLEGSNVNSVEELIETIALQREFEMSVRLISTAQELDSAGSRLMRVPGT